MERIETERLLIREWQKSDAPGLFAICQDPQLRRSGIGFYTSVEECGEGNEGCLQKRGFFTDRHNRIKRYGPV